MMTSRVSAYLTLYRDGEKRNEFLDRCRFILRRFCAPKASQKVRGVFGSVLNELELMTTFILWKDWPELYRMRDTYLAVQGIHSVLVPR